MNSTTYTQVTLEKKNKSMKKVKWQNTGIKNKT